MGGKTDGHGHQRNQAKHVRHAEQNSSQAKQDAIQPALTVLADITANVDSITGGNTSVHANRLSRIGQIARRKQQRWGEVAAGLGAARLAFLLGDALAITGPLLAGLGFAGALHGLLFPTRWIEIVARDAPPATPFEIHGVRRRSARKVLAVVRGAIGARRERPSANDGSGGA